MRTNDRGAIAALTLPGLGQLDGKVLLHAGKVIQAQILGLICYSTICEPRERREFWNEFAPKTEQLLAHADEFAGKAIQSRGVDNRALQQSIARSQRACVALEQRQVGGMRLGQEQIQESSASPGGPFD